jgi:hypothetical protein
MAAYRETAQFVVRIDLTADFDDDYEGDDDGYAWLKSWRTRVRPRVGHAVLGALRAEPGFEAIPTSRGASPDDELDIAVRYVTSETEPQK